LNYFWLYSANDIDIIVLGTNVPMINWTTFNNYIIYLRLSGSIWYQPNAAPRGYIQL